VVAVLSVSSAGDRKGFVAVPRYLVGTLTANEIAVYVALVSDADSTGYCYPTHARISAGAGLSESSVKRALVTLRERGVIEWTQRRNERGDLTSNFYKVNMWRKSDPTLGSQGTHPGVTVTEEVELLEVDKDFGTEVPSKALRPEEASASSILGDYLDWRKNNGYEPATASVKARIGKHIKDALAAGVSVGVIKRGLGDWHAEGASPAQLPAFIDRAGRGR
jgi:hypothetical protein